MLAYHGKQELKDSVVAQMAAHREADELVKGQYWKNGKGCAVGCLVKGNNHALYETMFGIPRALAYMEDRIFESLDNGDSQAWPERFLNAIRPGADLSMVVSRLMYWLMTDPEGICKHATADGLVSIGLVAALYLKRINGQEPEPKEWAKARDEAYKVRRDAAYAAAAYAADAAAAAYAAAAAAYAAAAAAAAAYAAAAAAAAAYDADAYRLQWKRISDKLIELLEAA